MPFSNVVNLLYFCLAVPGILPKVLIPALVT